MSRMTTVKFTARGKSYTHTFPHNPNGRGEEMNAFIKANNIRKQDIHNCQMTIDGWGFWAGYVF